LSPAQTNISLLLFAANGYLIKYAQEVRMYGLLLFFTLCSLWLFVKLLRGEGAARGLLLALTACNLLLVYTHYYGWLVVSTEAAFLLPSARRRSSSASRPGPTPARRRSRAAGSHRTSAG
jgi:uncharacterized membrane protein